MLHVTINNNGGKYTVRVVEDGHCIDTIEDVDSLDIFLNSDE